MEPLASKKSLIVNAVSEDIWRVIGSHLHTPDLVRLMGVNRALLNIALDTRYREVHWVALNKSTIWYLDRLQNATIARYVRRLHIRAWFIDYLLKREALIRRASEKNKIKRWLQSCVRLGRRVSDKQLSPAQLAPSMDPVDLLSNTNQRKHRTHNENQASSQMLSISWSSNEILSAMINAVKCMSGVVEYHFEWRDLPLNKHTQMFLTSARTSFQSSLRKLTLRAQIVMFQQILDVTDFEYLDQLDLHFDYTIGSQGLDEGVDPDAAILLTSVAPFINRCRASLRSLVIASHATVDLSPFFRALGLFPILRTFVVQLDFQRQICDHEAIKTHLARHADTLSRVEFKPVSIDTPSQFIVNGVTTSSPLKTKDFWTQMATVLDSTPNCLSNVELLTIPVANPKSTLNILNRSANTLTQLSLLNHFLAYGDIVKILDVFAHRPFGMKFLHLEVLELTYDLLQLLARRMLGLETLRLVYKQVETEKFTHDLSASPKFTDWTLLNLGIYDQHICEDPTMWTTTSSIETDLMERIKAVVPHIRYFKRTPRHLSR